MTDAVVLSPRQLRDFIETGPEPTDIVHESAQIRQLKGWSVYAVALCGQTFGDEESWVRGFGYDDRVTCPRCRDLAGGTQRAEVGK